MLIIYLFGRLCGLLKDKKCNSLILSLSLIRVTPKKIFDGKGTQTLKKSLVDKLFYSLPPGLSFTAPFLSIYICLAPFFRNEDDYFIPSLHIFLTTVPACAFFGFIKIYPKRIRKHDSKIAQSCVSTSVRKQSI